MFTPKSNCLVISLQRNSTSSPWGISVVGGADQNTPITITKVMPGSPSDKKLQEGDEIKKIEDYDSRDITHQHVNYLFQKSGTTIKLVVKRSGPAKHFNLKNDSKFQHYDSNPQPSWSNSLPADFKFHKNPQATPNFSGKSLEVYDNAYNSLFAEKDFEADLRNQPYRTTPLVLPGAKAKHEAPTGSYLRHHPNPMMRSGRPHYEYLPHDVAMKQKVADSILTKLEKDESLAGKQIIRKQFNTPIGLYSDKNIVDVIQHSGLSRSSSFGRQNQSPGFRKNVVYDPSKSETFKALQEEKYGDGMTSAHEVTVPAQPKIFTPGKQQQRAHQPVQSHTYNPTSHSSSPSKFHHTSHVNSMGQPDERIAQSGSFKRLMNMVLTDDY